MDRGLTVIDDELTYRDLREAALEYGCDPETTLREIRVLEHLKAMAGAEFIKRRLDAMKYSRNVK